MTNDSRMSKTGARRLLALTATAVITAMVLVSGGGGAGADTSGSPDTNTRAVISPGVTCPNATPPTSPCATASNGATPPSTLSGAAEGTPVSIHVDGQAGTFFGVNAARMCKSGLNVVVSGTMSPSTGNCVGKPFSGTDFQDANRQDDGFMQVSAAPSNTSVDFTFRVGSGTATWTDSGGTHSLTCDSANPCALWLWESVDTSISASGNIFKHYDINYAAAGTTSTTAGGTTTTTAGGTTTTTAGATTTTTAGATTTTIAGTTTTTAAGTTTTTGVTTTTQPSTTTTTAGGTTTTTAGGTTTTTAVGATTTTVPTGTTTTTRPTTTTTTAGGTTTTTAGGTTTTTSGGTTTTTSTPPPPSTHDVTGVTRIRTLGPGDWFIHNAILLRGLQIEPGANVTIMHSTILHGIKADAGSFTLCGSLVTNGVKVRDATGFVLIGDPFDDGCARNLILGGMSLQSNTAGVEAVGNQISGHVTVSDNSGTGPQPDDTATELEANRILGPLACDGNTPPPVNDGLSNVVSGPETGQCKGL